MDAIPINTFAEKSATPINASERKSRGVRKPPKDFRANATASEMNNVVTLIKTIVISALDAEPRAIKVKLVPKPKSAPRA
ncbi:unannotated protein [freshwater metagenome]|uniref:Unannotated protein n=1 Tax=freshwater metagenome TaxID=449393 RepID=A0A6J7VAF1_9ZZZZ